MQRKKIFSIITIICFASVIFIPIGLVLMAYFTDWPKKRKIIIGVIMTVLYIVPVVVLSEIHASSADKVAAVEASAESAAQLATDKLDDNSEITRLPSTIEKHNRAKINRWVFPVIFFSLMLVLIIIQNIKGSKVKEGYQNPFVDVSKYKLPIKDSSKLPEVNFDKFKCDDGEHILFAVETVQTDNEGYFAITNKKVVINNKEGNVSYKFKEITMASSISDTVMFIASGNEKNYIFLPDGQMKYALGVIKFAYDEWKSKK